MSQDQTVRAQDVLRSVMALRRQGREALMRQLEAIEPDLAEFLLEEISAIFQLLSALGGRPRPEQRVIRRVEAMGLVLVMSLREAQLRLWTQEAAGTRLVQIDPSLAQKAPGGPPASDDRDDSLHED